MTHRSSTEWRRRRCHISISAIRFSPQTTVIAFVIVAAIRLPFMMRGSRSWPAVASSASATVAPTAATMHSPMGIAARRCGPGIGPGARDFARSSAYAATASGKPLCQNTYNQAVVWSPAPSRPVGANSPGKVSMWVPAMKPVNR